MITDRIEIDVLRELRKPSHTGWLTSAELADRLNLPAGKVRATLYQLKSRFLVKRGNAALGNWGEWSITENGMVDLAAADTLRLVR